MIHSLRLKDILFLDIETVPEQAHYSLLNEHTQKLWSDKSRFLRERKSLTPEEAWGEAGIYSEFGRIICISTWHEGEDEEGRILGLRSFYGNDENKLLRSFRDWLDTISPRPVQVLCAHNGKEFDFPYLCRRLLANGLSLPRLLQLSGKKPWEIPHLDTMELWKFGDYKHYTSLALLAKVLQLPSPKEDIDGSLVKEVYYGHHDLDRIVRYCENDVKTVAGVLKRFMNPSGTPATLTY